MIYRLFFKLLVSTRIGAERAHRLACLALRAVHAVRPVGAAVHGLLAPRDPELRVTALGRTFPSPLGVAAGFDKDAKSYDGLAMLGFGYVEVGTVTARQQPGNATPRIWRLPAARAVMNSMGFPNPGADSFAGRLARPRSPTVVGVNVGKSRDVPLDEAVSDYRYTVRRVAPHADYLVLNVSSPNTPGLREMQGTAALEELLVGVREELAAAQLSVPTLVKIAPDLSDAALDAIVDAAVALGLDGIVAVNTTVPTAEMRREIEGLADLPAASGGLSGAPLKRRSLEVLERVHARAGDSLTLVSVGGIETAEDVWERIRAGATLVQAHTGFVYGGPLWPSRINRGLARLVRQAGMASIDDAIGTGAVSHHSASPIAPGRATVSTPLAGRVA